MITGRPVPEAGGAVPTYDLMPEPKEILKSPVEPLE